MVSWKKEFKPSICSMPGCEGYALERYKGIEVCCHCKQKLEYETLRLDSERITTSQMKWHKQLRAVRLGEYTSLGKTEYCHN